MNVARQGHRWWSYRRPAAAAVSVAALGTLFVSPTPPVLVKDDRFITAATTGILDIEVTECFDDPAYSRSANEEVVRYRPCGERADNQAYGIVHVPDGPFDPDALATFAWDSCERGFAHYWGSREESGLDYYPIVPTAETWADGDRDVMCAVYNPQGKLPGSALPRHDPFG
ncbi:hypothetical protein CA850_24325 [Micromonospora echinospora]|uniref:Septum formation n=1 Tax=Micromonospora echinospora TaxID=1877 RepID=A0A1C4YZZ0_MICEC|nr:hypothetical protein [Micromonospora echinospora]OZV77142.1 hypothetical protein CA850_24325 [Micromonospora echinospora]SCF26295.1 Septum formation [Micromonospora echinospora]